MVLFNNDVNIYIISLVRALDRREKIQKSLETFNHTYSFFDAVDGSNKPSIEELKLKYNSTLADNHAACAISHIMLLEQFLKSNDKYIIILEDDAKILKKLPTNVDEVESMFDDINNPDNIDLLYLHNRVRCSKTYKITGGCGTESYICSRIGASKIINALNPLSLIDIQLNNCIKEGVINGYRSKYIYCKEDDNNYSYICGPRKKISNKYILPIGIGLSICCIIGVTTYCIRNKNKNS